MLFILQYLIFFSLVLFGYVNLFLLWFSVIEHLPQELRDRFTEMREMDLGVQSMYSLSHNIYVCYL